ncbi:MAG: hypothetical protein IJU54_00745 [Alphaproteobacteria bacterium]|nr:hypothetical protein [Alphaproteobacteria bacterium]
MQDYNTIRKYGSLYFNRYTNMDIKLHGRIDNNMHIIYPNNCKKNPEDTNSNEWKDEYKLNPDTTYTSYSKTEYFPNLYWDGTSHEYAKSGESKYHFEDPANPIVFDDNKMLTLNTDSEFSKYDVQLWDQCLVKNGKYRFNTFVNTENNKDKYIDLDTVENLFCDGKTYKTTGLLNNMPSVIYIGLVGNKDIRIKPDTKELKLFGDNTQYTGILYLHPSINTITFTCKDAIINNINFPNSIPNTGSNKDTVPFVKSNKPRTLTISIPFDANNNFDCIDALTIPSNTIIHLSNIGNTKRYKFSNLINNKSLSLVFKAKTEQPGDLKFLKISNNEYVPV